MARLWSIQSKPFFDHVLGNDIGMMSWKYVDKTFQDAYRWMAEQTTQRLGLPSNGHPSFWAWHSCGAWQNGPIQEDFIALFGTDPQTHLQLQVATLEVDEDDFSLSLYGPWCDMLSTAPFDSNIKVADKLWVESAVKNKQWRDQGNDHDIQATMLSLKRDQIIDIKTTKETFGLW